MLPPHLTYLPSLYPLSHSIFQLNFGFGRLPCFLATSSPEASLNCRTDPRDVAANAVSAARRIGRTSASAVRAPGAIRRLFRRLFGHPDDRKI